MHEPAILALADTGLVTGTIRLALADMLKNVESALAAGLSGIPEKQERQPSNHSQQTLLDAFAEKYLDLTGESPTVSKASKHRDNRHL